MARVGLLAVAPDWLADPKRAGLGRAGGALTTKDTSARRSPGRPATNWEPSRDVP